MVAKALFFRQGSDYRHSRFTELKTVAQVITEKDGILIAVVARNNVATLCYLKFYNKRTLVTPASDDPDHQIPLFGTADVYRVMRFDSTIGTFTGGMQIAAATGSGAAGGDPGTGFGVDVYWKET